MRLALGFLLASMLVPVETASAVPARRSTPSNDVPTRTSLPGEPDLVHLHPPIQALGTQTLYLNRRGISLTPGTEDNATTNTIGPVYFEEGGPVFHSGGTIAPFAGDEAAWQELLGCIRAGYAPFDVNIVETEPGAATSYLEIVIGGQPTDIGVPNDLAMGWGGGYCEPWNHSFAFVFSSHPSMTPDYVCKVVLQESAHGLGLADHLLLCGDAMTYLDLEPGCDPGEQFLDQSASCGEFQARSCLCGGSTKNSKQLLLEMVGPTGDTTPPIIDFARPRDGDYVDPGFTVEANASDTRGVVTVELAIDGVSIATDNSPPWAFTAPADLAPGSHRLDVTAGDGRNETSSSITVTVGDGEGGGEGDPGGGGEGGIDGGPAVIGGCSVGTGDASTPWFLLCAFLPFVRRRRRA